jgi:hypothetical protein
MPKKGLHELFASLYPEDISLDQEGRIVIADSELATRLKEYGVAAAQAPQVPLGPNKNCGMCNTVRGCGPLNTVKNCGCGSLQ